jgi:hypothetical protein
MSQKIGLKLFPIDKSALGKRMLVGGLIGLSLITVFLSGGEPNPEWSKLWFIRPLIIVPLAGATGGAFNYLVSSQHYSSSWVKAFAIFFSMLVFLVGLWMGFVLGLDGTYWD